MATSQRPLSEISPVAHRRNSPSNKSVASGESSPFHSSPLYPSNSPRLFWQGRDPGSPYRVNMENKNPYDSPSAFPSAKRSSIENLKRASRVKNSSMFARELKQEYDPNHVQLLERPLAAGRPLSYQIQKSGANPSGIDARRQLPSQNPDFHNTSQEMSTPPPETADEEHANNSDALASPSTKSPSPGKSSMSRASLFGVKNSPFDPRREIWSDEEVRKALPKLRTTHRQTKSVTFDAAPPQINEYEMTTPVPSSASSSLREGSFDSEDNDDSFEGGHAFDIEDSFDASLEDTDKTPVVLPDEWRFMTPGSADDETVSGDEDPFYEEYGSPEPEATPVSSDKTSRFNSRIESLDSNGERRPLPPLPPSNVMQNIENARLTSTLERASSISRGMPLPLRPASYSKADINDIGNGSLSLEDRLRLMMTQDQENYETQRERRMRRAGAKDRSAERDCEENEENDAVNEQGDDTETDECSKSPRISRDSILRNIQSQNESLGDGNDTPNRTPSPEHFYPLDLDPDVPIPSLESDSQVEDDTITVKEENEHEIDLYAIPEFHGEEGDSDVDDRRGNDDDFDDDKSSRYSYGSKDHQFNPDEVDDNYEDEFRGATPDEHCEVPSPAMKRVSDVSSRDVEQPLDMEFLSYVDQSTPPAESQVGLASQLDISSTRNSLQRPETPKQADHSGIAEEEDHENGADEDRIPTPDSVVRRSISEDGSPEPSTVPDPISTVKAPGAVLKTRPSLAPADTASMAAIRRKVSGQEPPPIQESDETEEATHNQEASVADDSGDVDTDKAEKAELCSVADALPAEKRQSSLVKLDLPMGSADEGLSFGLDEEFDRVIEAQKVAFEHSISQLSHNSPVVKTTQGNPILPTNHHSHELAEQLSADTTTPKQRGYLMRQNTKVVVASSRQQDEQSPTGGNEGNPGPNAVVASPRKASQLTWTTEPWNGKSRRQSIKVAGNIPRKKVPDEPVPPLPGHESNVKDPANGKADEVEISPNEDLGDDEDRGRLFVKVVGVKDLDLPLPRGERSYFSLTLDNGLHCVTTSWLELGKSAPIGQEFELVVLQDLEFQLTLQIKPEHLKPRLQPAAVSSPPKSQKAQKSSTFSRVFASPKKRREMELRQQLETQQKADSKLSTANTDPYEKMRKLAAIDGSFARAYVSLGDYEGEAFGRPLSVDITCFNEWAVDDVVSSVKSKRSTVSSAGSGAQRRPPYKIGTLELQLLYVPKPKGATDDDLPKSMNACIREMREAENAATRSWEGFLSQQGGDCPYWRRRFFRLQGTKLTAFHEVTRQPRATINLAKASKLIDDRSILTQKETSSKGGRRRKSAFAEEEEGYMFVEEGFRIRFGNGEVIDFYADSRVEKEGWMGVLGETVGKGYVAGSGQVKAWTELVLRREKSTKGKVDTTGRLLGKRSSVPPPPPKDTEVHEPQQQLHQQSAAPGSKPKHKHHLSQPVVPRREARHQKTRSLIF